MISVLPWVAIAVILVEFVLVDELPAPRVRRVMIAVGVVLLLLTAFAIWRMPSLPLKCLCPK